MSTTTNSVSPLTSGNNSSLSNFGKGGENKKNRKNQTSKSNFSRNKNRNNNKNNGGGGGSGSGHQHLYYHNSNNHHHHHQRNQQQNQNFEQQEEQEEEGGFDEEEIRLALQLSLLEDEKNQKNQHDKAEVIISSTEQNFPQTSKKSKKKKNEKKSTAPSSSSSSSSSSSVSISVSTSTTVESIPVAILADPTSIPASASSSSNSSTTTTTTTSICVICHHDLPSLQNQARIKSCGHTFCRPCIKQWIEYRAVCPLCKSLVQILCVRFKADGTFSEEKTKQSLLDQVPKDDSSSSSGGRGSAPLECLDHHYFLAEVERLISVAKHSKETLMRDQASFGRKKSASHSASVLQARWGAFNDVWEVLVDLKTEIARFEAPLDPFIILQQLYKIQDALFEINSGKDLTTKKQKNSSSSSSSLNEIDEEEDENGIGSSGFIDFGLDAIRKKKEKQQQQLQQNQEDFGQQDEDYDEDSFYDDYLEEEFDEFGFGDGEMSMEEIVTKKNGMRWK